MPRHLKALPLFVLTVFFLFTSFQVSDSPSGYAIITKMQSSIAGVKTFKSIIRSWERFEGSKTIYTEIFTKINVNPFKAYIISHTEPNKGVELLYDATKDPDKVLVNAGRWLPNVRLSPFSGKLRKDQHHTIFETGFAYLSDIIDYGIKRALQENAVNDVFVYDGDITWNGMDCYKVLIHDPTFSYVPYTIKEGETLYDIALRLRICEYLIVEKNHNVDDYWDAEPGKTIMIPTSYAKKTILYIDKKTHLPVVQMMSDEKGQFEKYEYHNLEVNPVIKPEEFTPDWEEYGF